jgi:hypothetical protein
VPLKRRSVFTRLYGATSQKTVISSVCLLQSRSDSRGNSSTITNYLIHVVRTELCFETSRVDTHSVNLWIALCFGMRCVTHHQVRTKHSRYCITSRLLAYIPDQTRPWRWAGNKRHIAVRISHRMFCEGEGQKSCRKIEILKQLAVHIWLNLTHTSGARWKKLLILIAYCVPCRFVTFMSDAIAVDSCF